MCIIHRRQCKLIWKGDQHYLPKKKKPLAKLLVFLNILNMYESDSSTLLDQLSEIFWIPNCYVIVG